MSLGRREQLAQVARLEDAPALLGLLEHAVAQVLLEDLPVVDLLLERVGRHQPVDRDRALLPHAPRALLGLAIVGGVPVGIDEEHAVGAGEVDAEAAGACRQQEAKDRRVLVEVIDESEAPRDRRRAVEPAVGVAARLDEALHDVEHLARLAEDQAAVAAPVPHAQHLPQH
eukprot:scaffold106158_cov45-Phaeocystis_antarctica.AAC.2